MFLHRIRAFFLNKSPLILFVIGIYFCVILPFGSRFEYLPGELIDSRLNGYILEHFYRWLIRLDDSYWSAPFFYPYSYTIAFSENMIGSAPIYTFLRIAGLNEVLSFQWWIVAGYTLNFVASLYILLKFEIHPLAAGVGSFVFTFGLPVLAQEDNVQLLYRCFVPIACYYLWESYRTPKLSNFIKTIAATLAQYSFCIYIGFFLSALSFALILVVLYVEVVNKTFIATLKNFNKEILQDWSNYSFRQRIIFLVFLFVLSVGGVFILFPYYHVSRIYGFERSWNDVKFFLPHLKSFLFADNSKLWGFVNLFFENIPRQDEHQLFLGGAVSILIIIGLVFRLSRPDYKMPFLYLLASVLVILITIDIQGYSLYKYIYSLPGLDAIRAVARFVLVSLWPVALFSAWVVNSMVEYTGKYQIVFRFAIFLIIILLVAESIFYEHKKFAVADAEARILAIKQKIPVTDIANPILFLTGIPDEEISEVDAMLVARDLGWSTFNGYSGNTPPGYEPANTCKKLPRRIHTYMEFVGKKDDQFYLDLIKRTVVVGFNDCNPKWWDKSPFR